MPEYEDNTSRRDNLKELEEWIKVKESEAISEWLQPPENGTYWKGEANMASMILAKIAEMRENKV